MPRAVRRKQFDRQAPAREDGELTSIFEWDDMRNSPAPNRKQPMKPQSVFDLGPAEKLQLVEDLWDDLAANPDDVPLHDWQREELERRTENVRQNPA